MKHQIYQPKVEAMKRMKDTYMEAVSNGSVRYRTTHTTPDGTKWDLVLEPQHKSLLGHWSYLGIASKVKDLQFYKHFTFDSDRVHWSKLQPEDMINIMKYSLNGEWDNDQTR